MRFAKLNITDEIRYALPFFAVPLLVISGVLGFRQLHPTAVLPAMEFQGFPTGAIESSRRTTGISDHEVLRLPIRLVIPRIGLDTEIESVGITSGGAMDMPKKVDHVAWFQPGVLPGTPGSAVLDGHFGLPGGAFNDLHLLKIGDTIEVFDQSGSSMLFVVQKTHIYDRRADTAQVFLSDDGVSHLNLVTCQGVWSPKEGTYSHRLVVFTDRKTPVEP